MPNFRHGIPSRRGLRAAPLHWLRRSGRTKRPSAIIPRKVGGRPLEAVLQAQDHRDAAALCTALRDPSSAVRETAALALASVQDSASMPCLLPAPCGCRPRVRRAAAFALSFSMDTALLAKLDERGSERGPTRPCNEA